MREFTNRLVYWTIDDGSNNIEIKIDFRKRLINEGIVPPLTPQRPETLSNHQTTQQIPLFETILGHQVGIMMRRFAKVVEVAAHEVAPIIAVQYLLPVCQLPLQQFNLVVCFVQLDDGQVHCASAGVTRFLSKIASWHDLGFIDVGVELGFGLVIFRFGNPSHEVVHCFLGTVGIIDEKRVAEAVEFALDVGQCIASFRSYYYFGGFVSIDDFADEVAGSGVANKLQNGAVDVAEVVEAVGEGRG